jgi:mRNA-degrading endonuclease toxin of MazEF toxin-antitoxin module
MIRPGEIYLADFEEMEPHPVVVVSREALNRGNWVAAVLITSIAVRGTIKATALHPVPGRGVQLVPGLCGAGRVSLFYPVRRVGRASRHARR